MATTTTTSNETRDIRAAIRVERHTVEIYVEEIAHRSADKRRERLGRDRIGSDDEVEMRR